MNNKQTKQLCIDLMRADTEDDVVEILTSAGYWDSHDDWEYFGGKENNFPTVNNQQDDSIGALVEKIINSIDARLTCECLRREIHVDSKEAPQSIKEAVSRFFTQVYSPDAGSNALVKDWSTAARLKVAKGITVTTTGLKKNKPSITIADCGEGQTPNMVPNTLVSLSESNKMRIPFVQGKFNQGGTGALIFCGDKNLQLFVTRRDQDICKWQGAADPSDTQWSFTIVRREFPTGNRRSSCFKYLSPHEDGVLRFDADKMPIFPLEKDAYGRESESGTLVKLYEYDVGRYRQQNPRKDSLKGPLDLLLTDNPLPIRLHECRPVYWNSKNAVPRSFETNITGVKVRLDDDKAKNIEEGFPNTSKITVDGESIFLSIYAFKKGKAASYVRTEGVIFTVNGQAHHTMRNTDFFRRAGLGFMAKSILVIADCSAFSPTAFEKFFKTSRDRYNKNTFGRAIEKELIREIKDHIGLKALQNERIQTEVFEETADSKAMEKALQRILNSHPSLSMFLGGGARASSPFKPKNVAQEEKHFNGREYPTYFRFAKKEYGTVLKRNWHKAPRCRVTFDTDAENEYFARDKYPGEVNVVQILDGNREPVKNFAINLQSGVATLNLVIEEDKSVGDELEFEITVTDKVQIDPFVNQFVITVQDDSKPKPRPKHDRKKPPSDKKGDDRSVPGGITLPKPKPVYEDSWEQYDPPFTERTAIRISFIGENSGQNRKKDIIGQYIFQINMDNEDFARYVKFEARSGKAGQRIAEVRYETSMVLLAMALIQYNHEKSKTENDGNGNGMDVEDQVETFTTACTPFILPMLDSLGKLKFADIADGEENAAAA